MKLVGCVDKVVKRCVRDGVRFTSKSSTLQGTSPAVFYPSEPAAFGLVEVMRTSCRYYDHLMRK